MRHKSNDGLFSSNNPEDVDLWNKIEVEQKHKESSWIKALREMGVKLAHPDDGWVRGRGTEYEHLKLSWYAAFNDDPQVGDLIAIGRPPFETDVFRYSDESKTCGRDGYRICRVTSVKKPRGVIGDMELTTFHYEDTGIRVPSEEPKKIRNRRFRKAKK